MLLWLLKHPNYYRFQQFDSEQNDKDRLVMVLGDQPENLLGLLRNHELKMFHCLNLEQYFYLIVILVHFVWLQLRFDEKFPPGLCLERKRIKFFKLI